MNSEMMAEGGRCIQKYPLPSYGYRSRLMIPCTVTNRGLLTVCIITVIAGALDFTVCYDLTKVHFNSADCLNT